MALPGSSSSIWKMEGTLSGVTFSTPLGASEGVGVWPSSSVPDTGYNLCPLGFTLLGTSCCVVVKSYPTLHDPMDQSTPGPPVFHCLLELGQIHVGPFDDTVQPSRPLSSPSPLAFTLFQHQGPFQGVFSSHEMGKVLEPQLQDLPFLFPEIV